MSHANPRARPTPIVEPLGGAGHISPMGAGAELNCVARERRPGRRVAPSAAGAAPEPWARETERGPRGGAANGVRESGRALAPPHTAPSRRPGWRAAATRVGGGSAGAGAEAGSVGAQTLKPPPPLSVGAQLPASASEPRPPPVQRAKLDGGASASATKPKSAAVVLAAATPCNSGDTEPAPPATGTAGPLAGSSALLTSLPSTVKPPALPPASVTDAGAEEAASVSTATSASSKAEASAAADCSKSLLPAVLARYSRPCGARRPSARRASPATAYTLATSQPVTPAEAGCKPGP